MPCIGAGGFGLASASTRGTAAAAGVLSAAGAADSTQKVCIQIRHSTAVPGGTSVPKFKVEPQ
jgi:hypothetical protein